MRTLLCCVASLLMVGAASAMTVDISVTSGGASSVGPIAAGASFPIEIRVTAPVPLSNWQADIGTTGVATGALSYAKVVSQVDTSTGNYKNPGGGWDPSGNPTPGPGTLPMPTIYETADFGVGTGGSGGVVFVITLTNASAAALTSGQIVLSNLAASDFPDFNPADLITSGALNITPEPTSLFLLLAGLPLLRRRS